MKTVISCDKVNETGSTGLMDTKWNTASALFSDWACWWRAVFLLTVQLLALIFSTPAHLLLYHSKEGSLLSYLNVVYLWGTLSEKPLIYDLSGRNSLCGMSPASQLSQLHPLAHQLFSRPLCLRKRFQKLLLFSPHNTIILLLSGHFREEEIWIYFCRAHSLYSFQDTSEFGYCKGSANPVAFQNEEL